MKLPLDDVRMSLDRRPTDELISILRTPNENEWRPEVFDLVACILEGRGVAPAVVSAPAPGGDAGEHRTRVGHESGPVSGPGRKALVMGAVFPSDLLGTGQGVTILFLAVVGAAFLMIGAASAEA